jgi:hypothetical protein
VDGCTYGWMFFSGPWTIYCEPRRVCVWSSPFFRFRCILATLTFWLVWMDGFCAWNIVNVATNVLLTILMKQNLHVLMQILYLSKLNRTFKNAFKKHSKINKNTKPMPLVMPRKPK